MPVAKWSRHWLEYIQGPLRPAERPFNHRPKQRDMAHQGVPPSIQSTLQQTQVATAMTFVASPKVRTASTAPSTISMPCLHQASPRIPKCCATHSQWKQSVYLKRYGFPYSKRFKSRRQSMPVDPVGGTVSEVVLLFGKEFAESTMPYSELIISVVLIVLSTGVGSVLVKIMVCER